MRWFVDYLSEYWTLFEFFSELFANYLKLFVGWFAITCKLFNVVNPKKQRGLFTDYFSVLWTRCLEDYFRFFEDFLPQVIRNYLKSCHTLLLHWSAVIEALVESLKKNFKLRSQQVVPMQHGWCSPYTLITHFRLQFRLKVAKHFLSCLAPGKPFTADL